MPDVRVYPTPEALALAAAERFVALAGAAIAEHGRFCAALSGGETPRATYACLAQPELAARVEWPRVYLFWSDERGVPPDHPESNYGLARAAWLEHVPIPAANVCRVCGEHGATQAAAEYEARLRTFFAGEPRPRLDLVLLGLGEDGHTASLFPGSLALQERDHWVAAVSAPKPPPERVTLTLPAINAAAHILFLVSGAGKADILRQVLQGSRQPEALPAERVAPTAGDLCWLVDAAAASRIP